MKTTAGGDVERLIALLARLPGLGPRSARRTALSLLQRRESLLLPLIEALSTAAHSVMPCVRCGAFSSQSPCQICQDSERQSALICVVDTDSALWALERTKVFEGRYHVLGGVMSALDGIGPDQLRIDLLLRRLIDEEAPEEIIMALPATVEGQTTAFFIADKVRECAPECRITYLARGVPVGGGLDWLDDGTISHALKTRR